MLLPILLLLSAGAAGGEDALPPQGAPSGGSWGKDGLLYVTGHDRPELYAVRLPEAGSQLEWVATIPIPTGGQAITWDPVRPRTLWSIERKSKSVVASTIPSLKPRL